MFEERATLYDLGIRCMFIQDLQVYLSVATRISLFPFLFSCNVFCLCTLLCKHCMLQKILRMSDPQMIFFINLNHFVKLHYTYQMKDIQIGRMNKYDLNKPFYYFYYLHTFLCLAPSRKIYLHSLCTYWGINYCGAVIGTFSPNEYQAFKIFKQLLQNLNTPSKNISLHCHNPLFRRPLI